MKQYVLLLALAPVGCQSPKPGIGPTPSLARIDSEPPVAQVAFDSTAYKIDLIKKTAPMVEMTIGTGHVPATLTLIDGNDGLLMSFQRGGHEISREWYVLQRDSLLFSASETQKFTPPLPIFQFPLVSSASKSWTGTISLAGATYPATATIKGKPEAGYAATVELFINTGAPKPIKRSLKFWIDPAKGLYRTHFQYESSREPAKSSSDSSI